ncbi:MAG TPA: POTRA domain-containing protein [Polyangiaceae bacterium]|nr:POTRA domain-containing protein [Polyangiaceae bacterium]
MRLCTRLVPLISVLAALLALVVLCSATTGCATLPQGRAAIDSVDIVGAHAVDPADVLDKLASSDSPKFLGLMQGVAYDYSIYDSSVLQRDLARVERYYRGRGFFEAHVRVGRVIYDKPDHVRIRIVVDEGPPMQNRSVQVAGLERLPEAVARGARLAANGALPEGGRFDEDAYAKARTSITRALTDRGYAYATVTADARADMSAHAVDYAFAVTPGIAAVFGPITFQGLDPDGDGPAPQEIQEDILRRTLHIRENDPYSTADLESGTQALLDLGVFSSVTIVTGLSDPTARVVPLAVQVQLTKLRSVRLGFGAELDAVKTDVHGIVGWENHNFFGGLRDFKVDFTPGLVLFPTTISTPILKPRKFLPEERLRAQLHLPAFLEHRTLGFVSPEFNVFPLLVNAGPTNSTPVAGFIEAKNGVGLERRFGKHVVVRLAYNTQVEQAFRYVVGSGALSPLPGNVVLSFPQLVTTLDLRDDPVHTHAGFYATNDLQVAGGPFGGTATDVRIQPTLQGYIPLGRNVTFALSAGVGLLFPLDGYTDTIENLAEPSDVINGRDVETMYFRGFFEGGPSSNRGFPLRQLAPHAIVPFITPANANALVNCNPSASVAVNSQICKTPVGGFTMWSATAEVRFAVAGPIGAAVFCDAGDVSQRVADFRFDYLHLSCGVGGRYDTPIGPIRLDIGYRIQPLQRIGFPDESAAGDPSKKYNGQYGDPSFVAPQLLLGIPAAIAFGIGESF